MNRNMPIADKDRIQAPYLKIKNHLKHKLKSGEWIPGDRIPSESELCAQFKVSRITAGRALRELQLDGLIERIQGVGTFVSQLSPIAAALTIRDLHEEIVERGHRYAIRAVLKKKEAATLKLAQQFAISPGAPIFHTILVHLENDRPVQHEDRYVNPAIVPNYLDVDFALMTPTHYLLKVAPLWEADYQVQAMMPSAQEAKLLTISRTTPCLVITRQTFNHQGPITWVRLVHPGNIYSLKGKYSP